MINRTFDLVSPNIKAYIENRLKYLTCNPLYFMNYMSMSKSKLEEEANRHSVSIELVNFAMSKSEGVSLKAREKKRCEKNLLDARKWAVENYSLPLTREYIELVGSLVEPTTNEQGFRKDKIRISGSEHSPPSPEKLDRELAIFLWENEVIQNPLERAIHAHFGLARVHPFNDGNGRTCRLIQDVILSENGLPLPMIPLYERPEYIQKIGDAINSYYQREGSFRDKVSKILSDLNELAANYASLSESQRTRGKYLAKLIFSLRITPEQNTFYDFMALKVFGGLSEKLKNLYASEEDMKRYLKQNRRSNKTLSRNR